MVIHTAKQIERAIGDLVDLCAANPSEVKAVDMRAWRQLLVYAGFSSRHLQTMLPNIAARANYALRKQSK